MSVPRSDADLLTPKRSGKGLNLPTGGPISWPTENPIIT